jgi:GNAT superfamily N-acetyltransferase
VTASTDSDSSADRGPSPVVVEAIRLDSGRDPVEVIDVLADAFHDYPVMRFVLGAEGANDHGRLSRLVELFVMARIFRREPVFGVTVDGRLEGVATMSDPAGSPAPEAFLELREQIWADLGEDCRERYEAFGATCQPLLAEAPHLHLNMIGVRKHRQGMGLSTSLLNAVHDLAATTEGCTGVTLTTENPRNLSFYRRFGYRITGNARVGDGLETWAHFRPVNFGGSDPVSSEGRS